jgi:hypothetical protein
MKKFKYYLEYDIPETGVGGKLTGNTRHVKRQVKSKEAGAQQIINYKHLHEWNARITTEKVYK